MKRNNGITLIALVITIVVLIILAGVAISLSLGENGIFNKAKFATEEYANAQEYEKSSLDNYSNQMELITGDRNTSDLLARIEALEPTTLYENSAGLTTVGTFELSKDIN